VASAIGTGELLKDRYRLERTLGRGGMAAVWLGHDEVLERPVAVKVLSDTIASDPGFVARFRREAQTAAGLSHPNLVGVYDFSEEGERPYLVMQFVPGESLAARLERGQTVDRDKLARELLDAVAHIHQVGILHRDIKPGNIVIEPDGTAKLIDFGIALPRDATALTSTGLVLGTERYAAPEVMEGEPATERSDLYSCGLVLQSCEGECSRALRFLIGEMTSKDPRDRPLSARHALDRLEQPAVEVDQPTEVLRAPPPPPAPPPRVARAVVAKPPSPRCSACSRPSRSSPRSPSAAVARSRKTAVASRPRKRRNPGMTGPSPRKLRSAPRLIPNPNPNPSQSQSRNRNRNPNPNRSRKEATPPRAPR
jgi:serine/threonine protein kinase